jgi:hypothetical protein
MNTLKALQHRCPSGLLLAFADGVRSASGTSTVDERSQLAFDANIGGSAVSLEKLARSMGGHHRIGRREMVTE